MPADARILIPTDCPCALNSFQSSSCRKKRRERGDQNNRDEGHTSHQVASSSTASIFTHPSTSPTPSPGSCTPLSSSRRERRRPFYRVEDPQVGRRRRTAEPQSSSRNDQHSKNFTKLWIAQRSDVLGCNDGQ